MAACPRSATGHVHDEVNSAFSGLLGAVVLLQRAAQWTFGTKASRFPTGGRCGTGSQRRPATTHQGLTRPSGLHSHPKTPAKSNAAQSRAPPAPPDTMIKVPRRRVLTPADPRIEAKRVPPPRLQPPQQ